MCLGQRAWPVALYYSEKGTIHVSSTVFHRSARGASPFGKGTGVYVMPVRDTSSRTSPDVEPEFDELLDSSPGGLGCARAVQAAVLIEAAGALLIYGVWLLVHMRR